MEKMQWSEISSVTCPPNSAGVVNTMGVIDQHHSGSDNGHAGALGAPTIKNHSVTYFNDHLYCFGGYDGRRNHNLLLLYNIREHRWIRPRMVGEDDYNNSRSNNIESETVESNVSVPRVNHERADIPSRNTSNNNDNDRRRDVSFIAGTGDDNNAEGTGGENAETNNGDENETENADANVESNDSASEQINESQEAQNQQPSVGFQNNPYNRDIPLRNERDGFYPGMGGRRNSVNNNTYEYRVTGNPPPGRNGHSATLATDEDENNDENEPQGDVTGRIIVLGGWLGQGPLAASDMHVLDISRGGRTLRWYQPAVKGTPPGPCNMHSADYVKARKEVFVFRGGNGRFLFFVFCFVVYIIFTERFSDPKMIRKYYQAVNT